MLQYHDGNNFKVLDTPDFNKIDPLQLKHTIFRSKHIILLVDPFGFQENVESEQKSATVLIMEFQEMYRNILEQMQEDKSLVDKNNLKHEFRQNAMPEDQIKNIKVTLAFNKLDLPGAEAKMRECIENLNILNEDLPCKFDKVFGLSANETNGIQEIADHTKLVNDKFYEKYLLGKEHRRMLGLGQKWPPPSIKGPDSPVITEIPREKLWSLGNAPTDPRRIGGNMMNVEPRDGLRICA